MRTQIELYKYVYVKMGEENKKTTKVNYREKRQLVFV